MVAWLWCVVLVLAVQAKTDISGLTRLDVENMKAKQIKDILNEYKTPCKGCSDKSELVDALMGLVDSSSHKQEGVDSDTLDNIRNLAEKKFGSFAAMKDAIKTLGGMKGIANRAKKMGGPSAIANMMRANGMGALVDQMGGDAGVGMMLQTMATMDKDEL